MPTRLFVFAAVSSAAAPSPPRRCRRRRRILKFRFSIVCVDYKVHASSMPVSRSRSRDRSPRRSRSPRRRSPSPSPPPPPPAAPVFFVPEEHERYVTALVRRCGGFGAIHDKIVQQNNKGEYHARDLCDLCDC